MNNSESQEFGNAQVEPDVYEQLLDMTWGYIVTQAVFIATQLGVPDVVSTVPMDVDEIARRIGADRSSLYRLMRFLASKGIFSQPKPQYFVETPLSNGLRTDAVNGEHWMALMRGAEFYRCWAEALQSFRTGKPVFELVYGLPFFEYLAQHPERSALFDKGMAEKASQKLSVLLSYDWKKANLITDIGGGNGSTIAAVLRSAPHLNGILFDLPTVVESADAILQKAGVRDRCKIIAGNFFKDPLPATDVMILSEILHDWDDEHARAILENCHRTLANDGRLLLVEGVVPDDQNPNEMKLMDLHMLVLLGGKERTESEWKTLLEKAGFQLARIYPAGMIEARPV